MWHSLVMLGCEDFNVSRKVNGLSYFYSNMCARSKPHKCIKVCDITSTIHGELHGQSFLSFLSKLYQIIIKNICLGLFRSHVTQMV